MHTRVRARAAIINCNTIIDSFRYDFTPPNDIAKGSCEYVEGSVSNPVLSGNPRDRHEKNFHRQTVAHAIVTHACTQLLASTLRIIDVDIDETDFSPSWKIDFTAL